MSVSDARELRDLQTKRSSIKGRVTKFKNYLQTCKGKDSLDPIEINELGLKLSKFQHLFVDFDALQNQIEVLNEDDFDAELTERECIEQDFYKSIATAQHILDAFQSPVVKDGQADSASSASASTQVQQATQDIEVGFKLPVIKVSNFDGSYYKWLEFRDTFKSLIHDNTRIKNIHKFHYLLSYLEGEAARVLANLEVSDKNYTEAWKLLRGRYDNKRQLITNHLNSLLNIEPITRESDKALRYLIDHITKNLRALNTLGQPTKYWDTLIIHIMVSAKLDHNSCVKWEEYKGSLAELPTLTDFNEFINNRADVLESLHNKRDQRPTKGQSTIPPAIRKSDKSHVTKTFVVSSQPVLQDTQVPLKRMACLLCKGEHRIYDCGAFKGKSIEERILQASQLNLCLNCLRTGHSTSQCRLGSCRICRKRHNTMLHKSEPINTQSFSNDSNKGCNSTASATIAMSSWLIDCNDTLLCTASVDLINPFTNKTETVRALLDPGSQSSFVTEAVKSRLQLPPLPTDTPLKGIGNTTINVKIERCVVKLQSRITSFSAVLSCLVLPEITDTLPNSPVDISHFDLSQYKLADPSFHKPAPIDFLIGGDLSWDLIGSEQYSLGSTRLKRRSSPLGWLIAGPMHTNSRKLKQQTNCYFVKLDQINTLTSTISLNDELTKFWDLESYPESSPKGEIERSCEKHFMATTKRLPTGRFCVKLPLIDSPDCLGDSYETAKKQFLSLERRFKKQPLLKSLYSEFIHEYESLGHLSKSAVDRPPVSYFLPHHPVFKEKSESTKLRVVFNASSRTSSGLSVNDIQMAGPVVQDSLFNILIRFRQYKYVLSGDIEKMYRQIEIHETDRDLQLILWRVNDSDLLQTLRLNTVTYGFSSASYLSTRCLWQLGEECEDDSIKLIIQNDLYVDDLLTGANVESDLLYIQSSTAAALTAGGFRLRKYRSNLSSLLSSDSISADGELVLSESTSILGLGWNPSNDQLYFPIDNKLPSEVTKRTILSSICKIFDPLGLLSLCTIIPKIIIQQLWADKRDWDEPVPDDIKASWSDFSQNLHFISTLHIPRYVVTSPSILIETHTFCDASQRAFSACVYIKSLNVQEDSRVHLYCAKTRVAPVKALVTIPRLELCAALLAAQLTSSVTKALRMPIINKYYWTDSTIVLSWLQTDVSKLKVFVANRVSQIVELTGSSAWRHVPTNQNPADLASRGVSPQALHKADLWWHGPAFLHHDAPQWPVSPVFSVPSDLIELKAHVSTISAPFLNFDEFSSFRTLQRRFALVHRFYVNTVCPPQKEKGGLTVDELEAAFIYLARMAQRQSFPNEITLLSQNKPLSSRSSLLSLNPFMDAEGVIRVGGRLKSSDYDFDKKHPILMKPDHQFSKLYVEYEHRRLLHAGPQLLLASVREKVWPIGGRDLARRTYNRCVMCRRAVGKTMTNIMGNLPAQRVTVDFPFHTTGTDFAGPFFIADRKGRGCKISKCYLCIFICFRYKCVHLEAVSDLSQAAFILALRRFIARRGKPSEIFCDQGRNFVAADKEINSFLKDNSNGISDFATDEGIKFHFSPAYTPHFGGLWEAGVKSAKYHTKRILGDTHLTFEELASLFAQIEAILNSRPLCPLSSSPNDLCPLTPGHFLIGRSLDSLPTPNLLAVNPNRLDRYQRLESIRQHFWKRWQSEYISELQQRVKWRSRSRDLTVGDLVILKEDGLPPLRWRLGRVERLFLGADGVPRVVDVKTHKGTVRRAITRICLLPSATDSS